LPRNLFSGSTMMYIHHVAKLVRKQVYLTVEQQNWLSRTAASERRPEAEIIRDALDARARPQRAPRANFARDPLWRIVGIGSSDEGRRGGKGDVSENVDQYLYGAPRK
jgi:hypothetical protein